MKPPEKKLSQETANQLLEILHTRFEANMQRHTGIAWPDVQKKLLAHPGKLWSLDEMENTGGEPDVVDLGKGYNAFVFVDCSVESPNQRRSICYDHEALAARKANKPAHSAVEMAAEMGIELLSEDQYRALQQLGKFDTKTSSWILTPPHIRKLGGALFCDRRFDTVFLYHNGAGSYYAARGFRGFLQV